MSSAINFLTLYRDSARHQYFRDHSGRAPFYDARTGKWIISSPRDCLTILKSRNVRPPRYMENLKALESHLQIDLSSIGFAYDNLPNCLHGKSHSLSRNRLSKFIVARRDILTARVPEIVDGYFKGFARAGRIEVMSRTITPMTFEILSILIDLDVTMFDCSSISLVFDQSIGLRKRRKAASQLSALKSALSMRPGYASTEDDVGTRLALAILGKDSLLGTLGESLHWLFVANPDIPMDEIVYPELPPETGVPVIERVVTASVTVSGCELPKDAEVRLLLQGFACADDPGLRAMFFAAGVHSCLGRPLVAELWRAITKRLSRIPLRARVLSHSLKTSDYVFNIPDMLELEIYP